MQLNVKYRKVEDLIPYVNNSRKHSEEQVAQIAASIKEFGFTAPILAGGDSVAVGSGVSVAADLVHDLSKQRRANRISRPVRRGR
jgi:hypothetical protein